jgi:hypothetical protein
VLRAPLRRPRRERDEESEGKGERAGGEQKRVEGRGGAKYIYMFLRILTRSQGKTILAAGLRSNEPGPYDGGSDGANILGDVAGASCGGAAHLCWV